MPTAFSIAKEHADDDRALEADLYLAQRLRGDPSNLVFAMVSTAIIRQAVQHRSHAPRFAARYAPTDNEVIHILASEAMWARANEEDHGAEVDEAWRWLADAPRDRIGLRATIWVRAMTHTDATAPILPMYLDKMYAAVDDYERWLAR